MAWKVCFLESTICRSLGRRKIVLCAESIAICHEWKLMVRRTDTPFAEYDLLSRGLTQTHRCPDTCLLPVLPLSRCVQKRAKEDLTNACPLGGREQGCQCVSYFQEQSFCVLLSKLAEDRNLARALRQNFSKGYGMWISLSQTHFTRSGRTSGFCFLLFLSCWSDFSLRGTHSFLSGVDNSLQSACSLQGVALGPSSEHRQRLPLTLSEESTVLALSSGGKHAWKTIPSSSFMVETIAFQEVELQHSLLDAVIWSPFADVQSLIFIITVA